MKLFPLEPRSRTAINIQKYSRRLKLDVLATSTEGYLRGLIILGNGTPDDVAIAILSYHLNGKEVVGIVKPISKGLDAMNYVPIYLKWFHRGSKASILLAIDQKRNALAQLFDRGDSKL